MIIRKQEIYLVICFLLLLPLVDSIEIDSTTVFAPSGISTNYTFGYVTPVNINGITVYSNKFEFNVTDVIGEFPTRFIRLWTWNDNPEDDLNMTVYTDRPITSIRHARTSPTVIYEYIPSSFWEYSQLPDGMYENNITHWVNGTSVYSSEQLLLYFQSYYNISSVQDEVTGNNMTFNVTFSNTTHSETHNDITSFFSYYDNINITGYVTVTISSEGYTQRSYHETISSTVDTDRIYYLLPNTEGLFVRFHIINSASNPISGATINIFRLGNTIESTVSDDSGVGTVYLYPYYTYIIQVSHPSYTTYNSSIQPTSQDYTISLGGAAVSPAQVTNTNITYSVLPQGNVTATNTTFSFRITSEDSKLDWFSLNVTHHNGTQIFFQNSTNSSGGTISTVIDLSTYNKNNSIVTYAKWKKSADPNEYTITNSYYIMPISPSGLTDIKSISDFMVETLDLKNSDTEPKFILGLGVIILSFIGGAAVYGNGGGFISLGIIGIGLLTGLFTLAGSGSGIIVSVVFGLMCLAYVMFTFRREG